MDKKILEKIWESSAREVVYDALKFVDDRELQKRIMKGRDKLMKGLVRLQQQQLEDLLHDHDKLLELYLKQVFFLGMAAGAKLLELPRKI